MRLVNNPDSLVEFSHIIMDEVHERDLDIDFSMVVIKHLLANMQKRNYTFKLLLMSATFNTGQFLNYFSRGSIDSIESQAVYLGMEEKYIKDEKIKKEKMRDEWQGCGADAWDNIDMK